MEKFLIPYLKSIHNLQFTHHIMPEKKKKKMPRGDPWECTKVEKAISILGLLVAWGRGENESLIALFC